VVQPVCVPPEAAVACLLWFVSGDGTFEPLADAETVLLPRVLPAERVAGRGFDFLFFPALQIVDGNLPAAFIALIPVADRSKGAVDYIISRAPDPMLADLLNTGAARLAHIARMARPDALGASNIDCVLAHMDVLGLAIEPGAVNGAEALRLIGEIERAVLGRVTLSLDSVESTNRRLFYLADRMRRPDVVGIPSADRVSILLAEHTVALQRETANPRDAPAAALLPPSPPPPSALPPLPGIPSPPIVASGGAGARSHMSQPRGAGVAAAPGAPPPPPPPLRDARTMLRLRSLAAAAALSAAPRANAPLIMTPARAVATVNAAP
jgi:hypothetical protein